MGLVLGEGRLSFFAGGVGSGFAGEAAADFADCGWVSRYRVALVVQHDGVGLRGVHRSCASLRMTGAS